MKKLICILVFMINSVLAQDQELMVQFSLFNEDHKNNFYESAYEYGWNVINENPEPFVKYRLFPKMEEILFYMHDSVAASPEEKNVIADTTLHFYEKAVEFQQEKKPYWLAKKAFVLETWTDAPIEKVIEAYSEALLADPRLDTYYQDRYGQLLAKGSEKNPELKMEALELYSKLSELQPENPQWITRIENLAEDPQELLEITYKAWQIDPTNYEKAWKYASLSMKSNEYEKVIEPLLFLVEENPDVVNYWNQLATAYQKLDNYDKAMGAYKKLIELQPENEEHYVNLALMYMNKNNLSTARSYLQKAKSLKPNWDYPIYIEGTLYEQSARKCGFEFMDKVVYQLAVNTYREAALKSGNYSSIARERVSALSNSVPSLEDYFFRNIGSGDTIKIEGKCYDWINRSVVVP